MSPTQGSAFYLRKKKKKKRSQLSNILKLQNLHRLFLCFQILFQIKEF